MPTALATELPIHRLQVDTYRQLVAAGALDGLEVQLRDGLLVEKHGDREDPVHRLEVATYNAMVATGALVSADRVAGRAAGRDEPARGAEPLSSTPGLARAALI